MDSFNQNKNAEKCIGILFDFFDFKEALLTGTFI